MRQVNKEATPSQNATCEWFYHAPLKQSEQRGNTDVIIPPTSQIPGLSDLAEPHNEQAMESRRKWIRDTDSDYVKLSKQGGRPGTATASGEDTLMLEEVVPSTSGATRARRTAEQQDLLKQATPAPRKSPVAYTVPDWYTHETVISPSAKKADVNTSSMPDYMIHEDVKAEESDKYESRRGPFDFDMKTVWQRDADDNEKENVDEKKPVKLPVIKHDKTIVDPNNRVPPSTVPKQEHLGKKVVFPPMHASRSTDQVNFSKLLSNGYGDEWIQQRNDKDKKVQQKSKISDKTEDPAISEYKEKKSQTQITAFTVSQKSKSNPRLRVKPRQKC